MKRLLAILNLIFLLSNQLVGCTSVNDCKYRVQPSFVVDIDYKIIKLDELLLTASCEF